MNTIKPSFNIKKATALAVYFLQKYKKPVEYMKIIKLMYLADRAVLCDIGQFITNDDMYSLSQGPFLSNTHDLITEQSQEPTLWDRYIAAPEKYCISLTGKDPNKILNYLSDYEISVADRIYSDYGAIETFKLVELLHKTLPEWEDPGKGKRKEINIEIILRSCGKTDEEIKQIKSFLAEQAQMDRFFNA